MVEPVLPPSSAFQFMKIHFKDFTAVSSQVQVHTVSLDYFSELPLLQVIMTSPNQSAEQQPLKPVLIVVFYVMQQGDQPSQLVSILLHHS